MSEKHFGWQHKKIKNLFLGVAVATLTILGFVLLRTIEVRQDANKFAEADRVKQAVFEDLVEKMGETPTHIVEKDVCYNTEQGPYDNGRLWCQVASAAYFVDKIPKNEIRNNFRDIVRSKGLPGRDTPASGYVFYGADKLNCMLIVQDDISAKSPASFFPKNQSAELTIILECAGRAKAKHYPYEP